MCGITGFVNANGATVDRGVLERMNGRIVHRGPDDDGFYVYENAGLAMRRLAIIDVAGGQQPIHNADRTKWLVFNGEIYNYQALREDLLERGHELYTKSDTEAVLHLYEEHGEGCLRYLRGMFAFAIWDEVEKTLFLARDRVGKKPLLYSHQPNGDLIFGSEFMALLEHPSVSREVNYEALDSYFSYLCIPAPMTGFKAIRKLEPGHWLKWKDGKIETQRYWLPNLSNKIKIT
jgi:asparagine synthase (glutamine-hydrolysing)